MEYLIGKSVRDSAVFKTLAGVVTNPTAVTYKYSIDGGAATTLTYPTDAALVRDSIGNYHVDLALTTTGVYWRRWAGTGAVVDADEATWTVTASRV